MKPYVSFKDEIHIVDGLVFKEQTLIIPFNLRKGILSLIHEGHQGINRSTGLAKGVVFWPNINNDIKNVVSSCESCIRFSKKQC